MQFHFSDHVLDVDLRELTRGGESVAVEPQVFDLLVHLIENRDHVVTKDDLIETVWDGRIVSESTLTSRINAARKAVGDSGKDQIMIRTLARKGFRFVGEVQPQAANGGEAREAPQPLAAAGEPLYRQLPALDRTAIAVLPFANLSGEPEQEYFSEGIAEDIITALSKLRWFYVIARNSSFIYRGKSVHHQRIGEELGVGYVVEGSVRKDGDQVRITAQLVDVATGSHLWAERYDRNLADVFAVQDEITQAVVAAIEPQLYAAEDFRARRKTPDNMDAWDLVMRALSHYWRVTRQDNLVAQALLEKAISCRSRLRPGAQPAGGLPYVQRPYGLAGNVQSWSRWRSARRWRRSAPTVRTRGRIMRSPASICSRAALTIASPNSSWRCGSIRIFRPRAAFTASRCPIAGAGRTAIVPRARR